MAPFYAVVKCCLDASDVDQKLSLSAEAYNAWREGRLQRSDRKPAQPIAAPGRPVRPRLVAPRDLPRRKLHDALGRAALVHAIAHIEFNAINLALDAGYRFRDMPDDYYGDWLRVAAEEARHFALLQQRLHDLGYRYGDFDAHDGLWEMAVDTADDVLLRMALVPRVLEARGLDVTPGMIERLREAGDGETAALLELILREEVGHVEIGTRWFHYCCERAGLPPAATFLRLIREHYRGTLRGPFNRSARRAAGFSEYELEQLDGL